MTNNPSMAQPMRPPASQPPAPMDATTQLKRPLVQYSSDSSAGAPDKAARHFVAPTDNPGHSSDGGPAYNPLIDGYNDGQDASDWYTYPPEGIEAPNYGANPRDQEQAEQMLLRWRDYLIHHAPPEWDGYDGDDENQPAPAADQPPPQN